jgi:hypothetical protein
MRDAIILAPGEVQQMFGAALPEVLRAMVPMKDYDPNEPRDPQGQWTSGGGVSSFSISPSGIKFGGGGLAFHNKQEGTLGSAEPSASASKETWGAYFKKKLTDPDTLKFAGKVALVGIGAALVGYGLISGAGALGLLGAVKTLSQADFENLMHEKFAAIVRAHKLAATLSEDSATEYALTPAGFDFIEKSIGEKLGEEARKMLEAMRFDAKGKILS